MLDRPLVSSQSHHLNTFTSQKGAHFTLFILLISFLKNSYFATLGTKCLAICDANTKITRLPKQKPHLQYHLDEVKGFSSKLVWS